MQRCMQTRISEVPAEHGLFARRGCPRVAVCILREVGLPSLVQLDGFCSGCSVIKKNRMSFAYAVIALSEAVPGLCDMCRLSFCDVAIVF